MKEKKTKDIIMKVGQGLVRIPGDKVLDSTFGRRPENSPKTIPSTGSRKPSETKVPRS